MADYSISDIDPFDRLSTTVFNTRLPSPLLLASGTLVEEPKHVYQYLSSGAGAVVPRSTRMVMERKTHPTPHLHQVGVGKTAMMLNAEWTGADIAFWRPL